MLGSLGVIMRIMGEEEIAPALHQIQGRGGPDRCGYERRLEISMMKLAILWEVLDRRQLLFLIVWLRMMHRRTLPGRGAAENNDFLSLELPRIGVGLGSGRAPGPD